MAQAAQAGLGLVVGVAHLEEGNLAGSWVRVDARAHLEVVAMGVLGALGPAANRGGVVAEAQAVDDTHK